MTFEVEEKDLKFYWLNVRANDNILIGVIFRRFNLNLTNTMIIERCRMNIVHRRDEEDLSLFDKSLRSDWPIETLCFVLCLRMSCVS